MELPHVIIEPKTCKMSLRHTRTLQKGEQVSSTRQPTSNMLKTANPTLWSRTFSTRRRCSLSSISSVLLTSSSVHTSSSTVRSQTSSLLSSSFSSSRRLWLSYILLVILVVVECESVTVSRQETSDIQATDDYLSKFGYYPHLTHHRHPQADPVFEGVDADKDVAAAEHNGDADSELSRTETHTESERHHAIERLQSFFHLQVTGQLDTDTKKIMASARCGQMDVDENDEEERKEINTDESGDDEQAKKRRKRYSIRRYGDGTLAKWHQTELTWRITRPTRQISESAQREVMRKALAVWARYVPIRFVEDRGSGEPDINIQFARREHGANPDGVFDGSPKDNVNILAHAFHPGLHVKGFAGDVHFDDDDDWTDTHFLMVVAVHELGHSMGLDHSKDSSAVMFPVYQDNVELGQDDINGINALYGPDSEGGQRPPGRHTFRPPVVTSRPRTMAPYYTLRPEWVTAPPTSDLGDHCTSLHLDALFEDPTAVLGRVYVAVSGDYIHKLTSHGNLIQSQPLASVYPEVPASPDVAFSIPETRTVYFIKDSTMWAYKGSQLEQGYPRSLHNLQFPERPKFSVTLSDRVGNSRLLLFGANYWWTFEVDRPTTIRYDPISAFSPDLPSDVMFAATWADNQLYAVTKDSYVIMDLERRQITHQRPLAGKPKWLHELCGNGSRASVSVSTATLIALLSLVSLVKSVFL